MLESLVRQYANLKGLYITRDEHIEDLNGNLYNPVMTFNQCSKMTLTKANTMKRLLRWALG